MLNQFRTRYPQGSLLSELITIEHGQYIVKVLVQVEGITLATGLAASPNLEQAEDMARNRALMTLNLDSTSDLSQNHLKKESLQQFPPETSTLSPVENSKIHPSAEQVSHPNLIESPQDTPKPKEFPKEVLAEIPQPASSKVAESSSNGAKKGQTKSNAEVETASDQFTVEPVVPDANTLTFPSPSPTSEPPIPSLNVSDSFDNHPISSSSSTVPKTPKMPKTPKDKPQPVEVEETITESKTPEVLPLVESTPEIEIPEASTLFEKTPLISTPADEVAPLPSPTETSSSPAETLDFSEIMARSNAQLKRLGWTTEKGRDYLLKTYGKKSRHLLNDQELLEFLNYLETLPTP